MIVFEHRGRNRARHQRSLADRGFLSIRATGNPFTADRAPGRVKATEYSTCRNFECSGRVGPLRISARTTPPRGKPVFQYADRFPIGTPCPQVQLTPAPWGSRRMFSYPVNEEFPASPTASARTAGNGGWHGALPTPSRTVPLDRVRSLNHRRASWSPRSRPRNWTVS